MRLLLLWTGAGMTAGALLLLVAALVSRDVRVRRRARVAGALQTVIAGGHPGPLPGRVGRAVVLEVADRIGADSLTPVADLVRSTAAHATADLSGRRWVRRAKGLRTLMPLGLTPDELLAGFADRAPGVRAQAATAAAGRTEPEVLDGLVRLLDDPAPYVRFSALDAVAHRGAGVADALGRALRAAQRLDEHQLPEREQALARAEASAVRTVRELAALAAEHEDAAVVRTERVGGGVVAVALRGTERDTPGRAGTLPRPLRATHLVDTATRTLLLLLRGAGASAEAALLEPVRRFADDARAEVRVAAVDTLAALGADPSVVLHALDDPDGRVRAAAAGAVGRTGGRAMAGRLAPRLSDRDHGVRQATAAALATLGAAGALVLKAALSGPDPYAADAARSALGLPPVPRPDGLRDAS